MRKKTPFGIRKIIDAKEYWLKKIDQKRPGAESERVATWTKDKRKAQKFETAADADDFITAEKIRGGETAEFRKEASA